MKNFIGKQFVIVFLTLFITLSACAHNKIIYLISPPRSLSVAFLRMMQARGDFIIMHEPSMYAFTIAQAQKVPNIWFNPSAFQSFENVKKKIFEYVQEKSVFIKEMSFSVKNFLLKDSEFIRNPAIYFVFLVRNPHHSVISLYKKFQQTFEMFTSEKGYKDFSNRLGYKSLYEICCMVRKNAVNKLLIILSEDLYGNPFKTITDFCNHCDIPFKEDALQWKELGDDFSGEEWNELKKQKLVHYWHKDAIRSTGFFQPLQYEIDKNGEPTFSEIENLEHRTICIKAYKKNLNYYNWILQDISF